MVSGLKRPMGKEPIEVRFPLVNHVFRWEVISRCSSLIYFCFFDISIQACIGCLLCFYPSLFPELSLIKRLKRKRTKTKQNKQKQQQKKLVLNWLVKGNNGASSLIIDFFLLEKFRYSFIPTHIRKSCHESNSNIFVIRYSYFFITIQPTNLS